MFKKLFFLLLLLPFLVGNILVFADIKGYIGEKKVEPPQLFELPLDGATGYASVDLDLYQSMTEKNDVIMTLEPGQAFRILGQENQWLHISYAGQEGYVRSLYCMINLPDIIPSIVYKHTNASASILISSGKNIPNITGKKLYDAQKQNERFQGKGYIMPILFPTALKIQDIQKRALADNNTLVIYETFRPYEVQRKISDNLSRLMKRDVEVKNGLTKTPWSIGWFISQGTSNHQRGYALDVSLAKIEEVETLTIGTYTYTYPKRYTEYIMQSAMHELSAESVIFDSPVNSRSSTAWKGVKPAKNMSKGALLLQSYFTKSSFTPLASEWWHFNDLATGVAVGSQKSDGKYYLSSLESVPPKAKEEPSIFDTMLKYVGEMF